jgi:hypothetical protein
MNDGYGIYIKKMLEELFNELNKAKVKYLVAGGVAVILHGLPRITGDLDILLYLDKENLKRLDKAISKWGYVERIPVSLLSLGDHKLVRKWFKEKNLQAFTLSLLGKLPLQIDIIIEESLKFDKFEINKVEKKDGKLMIPVVSIDDLIRMKKKAGRAKDLIDLDALLGLKKL